MSREDASTLVDLDQLERLLWWGATISFAVFLVALVGEVRGWWNDAGEIVLTLTGLVGSLLTVVALLINATKTQVRNVVRGVTDNGRRLGLIHDGVRDLHEETERQTDVLVAIRDRL